MISFNIVSYISVGPIIFDSPRKDIVDIIGPPDRSYFYKGGILVDKDYYPEFSCHVLYGENQRCNSVEFHEDAIAEFQGVNFLKFNFKECIEWMNGHGYLVEHLDNFGFRNMKYGLAIYSPGCLQDPESRVEAFMAFGHGEWGSSRDM